jgi:tetratricopeptide (TPR) repeat protein
MEEVLAAEFPEEPKYRQELALGQVHLGQALRETGKLDQAEKRFQHGVALGEALTTQAPDNAAFRLELAAALNSYGKLYQDTSRLGEAETTFSRAAQLCQDLMNRVPEDVACRQEMAASQAHLARVLRLQGERATAVPPLTQAVDLRRALLEKNPQIPQYRLDLAHNLAQRGSVFWGLERFDEAERDLQESLALSRSLVRDFPTVPAYRTELTNALTQLGLRALNMPAPGATKDRPAAEAYFREALAGRRWLVEMYPRVQSYQQELARTCNQLGQILRAGGQRADVENFHKEALDISTNLVRLAPNVPDNRHGLGVAQFNLAKLRLDDGEVAAARGLVDEAIVNLVAALEPNYRQPTYRLALHRAIGTLADICFPQRDYEPVARAVTNALQRNMQPDTTAVHEKCARLLRRCASMAAADTRLSPTQRSIRIGAYLELADVESQRATERRSKEPAATPE